MTFPSWRGAWCAARAIVALAFAAASAAAGAQVGLMQRPGLEGDGPVTLYYPTAAAAAAVRRGPFTLQLAPDAAPAPGNGRLIVITHGSGAAPWVYADLATRLVAAGFVVALPEHQGDNARDPSTPGPQSWARRPGEVSRAIDLVAADPAFGPRLALDRVGVYGFSAGGHTALTLAGGRWSPRRYAEHCEAHIGEDFNACVGLLLRQTGGPLDGLKRAAARFVIGLQYRDATLQGHDDPRVAAVVAGMPHAASFDPASLAAPRVPLALITAAHDRWLVPRFHSDVVLAACQPRCELLLHLADGGHGALLSPMPPRIDGLLAELIGDPPGFDRAAATAAINEAVAGFFVKHLLGGPVAGARPLP